MLCVRCSGLTAAMLRERSSEGSFTIQTPGAVIWRRPLRSAAKMGRSPSPRLDGGCDDHGRDAPVGDVGMAKRVQGSGYRPCGREKTPANGVV